MADFLSVARMRAFWDPKPKIPFLPSDKISTVILSRSTPSSLSALSIALSIVSPSVST